MSYNVSEEWYYYLRGRELILYQLLGGSTNERITQTGVLRTRDNELMYPNENIEDGLRIEYTALDEPFVKEALETTNVYKNGTTISFEDGTGTSSAGRDCIDLGSTTATEFAANDKIRVQGSASNDGDYTILAIGTDVSTSYKQLDVVAGSFTTEAVGERITITQIPVEDSSPSETSHPNVNQMLCLAVVDYVKAMKAESQGDLTSKEYYIREFYSKLGDNEGNKRKMAMSFPAGPYAVR
tara:strand:+ start:599 stop:1318 length:720 start_codon:yes stop_codon:yes gene_type:complete